MSGNSYSAMKILGAVVAVLCFGLAETKALAAESHQRADLVVAADGSGDVKSLQEAINRVPENNRKRFVIFIKPGIYNEQIKIPASKPYVSCLGEKAEETKITSNVKSTATGSPWPHCSVYIGGDDFHTENITFENSFGARAQAMAVVAKADRLVFKNCRFLSWQDTLYGKTGRQYFENCYIEGSKDFICGEAAAVFENCRLHSKSDGYIAAPMRFSAAEPSGFVFFRCKLTGKRTGDGSFLGRPWGPYGRAIYLETEMGPHIRSEGWDNWGNANHERTTYFAEYNCKGAGANPTTRVKWSHQLGTEEARQFETGNFLKGRDGWNPKTADDQWLEKNPPHYELSVRENILRKTTNERWGR